MKNQSGFTLIELIIVIVILGILAVTAVPKFIDISSDAHRATMKQLEGSLKEAIKLVYMKSVIEGEENINRSSSPDVDGIDTHWGYPVPDQIRELLNLSESDWEVFPFGNSVYILPGYIEVYVGVTTTYTAAFTQANAANSATGCNITYKHGSVNPATQSIPEVTSYLGGC
jgi:prepilin-type N-terminal cleavage/methylation domain-containing protein